MLLSPGRYRAAVEMVGVARCKSGPDGRDAIVEMKTYARDDTFDVPPTGDGSAYKVFAGPHASPWQPRVVRID